MKRFIAVATVALVAFSGLPAHAGKAKHVTGSIEATLLPFPKRAVLNDVVGANPGCSAGEQDVHWASHEFTAPGKGTLRFYAEGFTGDWDLYVFDGETVIDRSESGQVTGDAPPEEEILLPLKRKQTVTLVVCNWLGDPNVSASYEGHFK